MAFAQSQVRGLRGTALPPPNGTAGTAPLTSSVCDTEADRRPDRPHRTVRRNGSRPPATRPRRHAGPRRRRSFPPPRLIDPSGRWIIPVGDVSRRPPPCPPHHADPSCPTAPIRSSTCLPCGPSHRCGGVGFRAYTRRATRWGFWAVHRVVVPMCLALGGGNSPSAKTTPGDPCQPLDRNVGTYLKL